MRDFRCMRLLSRHVKPLILPLEGSTRHVRPTVRLLSLDTNWWRRMSHISLAGYVLMVTADHGNAEKMRAPDGSKHTAHTCNPVPFTCSSSAFKFKKVGTSLTSAVCPSVPYPPDVRVCLCSSPIELQRCAMSLPPCLRSWVSRSRRR